MMVNNPVSLADLRTMDLAGFQALLLKAFKRLGYSVWLSEKLNEKAVRSVLVKNEERCLVQCSQEKELVDISLIKDFCHEISKKEGIESGFFVTTGVITLLDRSYLLDTPVDFIGAKKLLPFLATIFGEDGLRREVSQGFERRKSPRLDLRNVEEDKILWRVNTLYGTTSQLKREIADISCGGIGFESLDEIPLSSLLRLELFLYGSREAIKSIAKVIWEKAKSDSLAHNFGLSFFLISDKDKEQISNFVNSRLSREIESPAQESLGTQDGFESDPEFLVGLLIEKNIIGSRASDLDNPEKREVRRIDEVDIKKVEASVRRFFKKMFLKKCKILEARKIPTGWEALAKKIDSWFEKRGYRDVYEKNIYVVKLDDKFKVLSYSQVGSSDIPKSSVLETSQLLDTNKVREIVKEVAREVSVVGGDKSAEKLAQEVANEIEKRRESQDLKKGEGEEISIREAYISPLKEIKIERSFNRIGKVKKAKKGIENQVKSLRGVKKRKGKNHEKS